MNTSGKRSKSTSHDHEPVVRRRPALSVNLPKYTSLLRRIMVQIVVQFARYLYGTTPYYTIPCHATWYLSLRHAYKPKHPIHGISHSQHPSLVVIVPLVRSLPYAHILTPIASRIDPLRTWIYTSGFRPCMSFDVLECT